MRDVRYKVWRRNSVVRRWLESVLNFCGSLKFFKNNFVTLPVRNLVSLLWLSSKFFFEQLHFSHLSLIIGKAHRLESQDWIKMLSNTTRWLRNSLFSKVWLKNRSLYFADLSGHFILSPWQWLCLLPKNCVSGFKWARFFIFQEEVR